ncbi:MAG: tRNA-dihydrouridine synthase, partial [Candidatus Hydrogenedentes bacterium]|nr:tRNA-dihydrouridine synthase [Candidatus Hydrogenedentota bacterium]
LAAVFDAGAERAILGTAALRDPEFLRQATQAYPGRIAVGIDANNGHVAVSAWADVTDTPALEFACEVERRGAARIIYTDILSDGMMGGPNLDATRALAQAVAIPVTASGGMSSLDDVRRVRALEPSGVDEVIVGRALYLKAFTLPEAMAVARGDAP